MKGKFISILMTMCFITLGMCVLTACSDHEHTLVKVDAVSASCETQGNNQYYKCDCGMYFSDSNGSIEIAKDSWVIDALGHTYQVAEWYDNDCLHIKKMVCSRNSSHVKDNIPVNVTVDSINSILNDEDVLDRDWSSYNLVLSAGNYDKISLERAGFVNGVGDTVSTPKYFNREIGTLSFTGVDKYTTILDGFQFVAGFSVKYVNENDGSGGLDYYVYSHYTIDTLVFSNMTITDCMSIYGVLDSDYSDTQRISINNIVFDNVNFDFTTTEGSRGIHIVSAKGGISNVTVTNCSFTNFSNIPILVDTRQSDDINVTISNCTFTNVGNYNAIQISGSGSRYTGNIAITNNTMTNGNERAIRIHNIGAGANIVITGNVMTNISDADGEMCKASSFESGATINIRDNYWESILGTTAIKGMIVEGAVPKFDEAPRV